MNIVNVESDLDNNFLLFNDKTLHVFVKNKLGIWLAAKRKLKTKECKPKIPHYTKNKYEKKVFFTGMTWEYYFEVYNKSFYVKIRKVNIN